MINLKGFSLLFGLFLCLSYSYGQNTVESQKEYHSNLKIELAGTYQCIVINTRSMPAITTEMLEYIKSNRHLTEQVIYQYSPSLEILILSKNEVDQNLLIPENERTVYTTK